MILSIIIFLGTLIQQGVWFPWNKIKSLNQEIKILENRKVFYKENLKNLNEKNLENKKITENSEEKFKIFSSSSEFFLFIEKIVDDISGEIKLIGRDSEKEITLNKIYNSNFFKIVAPEKNMIDFIKKLADLENKIKIENNNLKISTEGNSLSLDINLMYSLNNKKIKNEQIEQNNKRNIKKFQRKRSLKTIKRGI